MTTALRTGSGGAATDTAAPPRPADAFVASGTTGDLAKGMTFRSLDRLEARGLLDCPIIGVAVDDWTVEDLADRARSSIVGTGEALEETGLPALAYLRFANAIFEPVWNRNDLSSVQITLDMEFPREGGEGTTPYGVPLQAAMRGNITRCARQDSVEEAWRVMQPLIDAPPPVHPYAPGSWGPEAADRLVAGDDRWYGPRVAS